MAPLPGFETWIIVPAIAGLIGWVTNWIAVKMIFRPIRPVNVLGFRVQGLVGRRQQELARAIGKVVGNHLVENQDVMRSLDKLDFTGILASVIETGLAAKVQELRSLPLIGGFLTEDRVVDIRDALLRGIMAHKDQVLEAVERGLAAGLDVPTLVEQKVAAFAIETLERLILEVAGRELRAIEWLGGVLRVLIGLSQVLLPWLYASWQPH
ncbi:MAG TPA: DUF445 family protein [Planctomycetota bacterium]|nr:DUF445 family protein [Planctomycetota bacterium]